VNRLMPVLAVVLGVALPHAVLADSVFAGGAPGWSQWQGTINGKPVTIVQMWADYHEMDLPPGHTQPIGLIEYVNVALENPTFQARRCEKWIEQVQHDEADWTEDARTYPYLEIDIASHAKFVLVDAEQVYRAKDVLCWEAMDFGPPVY